MQNISKATTKTYYTCRECKKKMETIEIKSNGTDIFGLGLTSGKAFYCDDNLCKYYGFLTIAGIKVEE